MLLAMCCPKTIGGGYVAEELHLEQTLENLNRLSERLAAADAFVSATGKAKERAKARFIKVQREHHEFILAAKMRGEAEMVRKRTKTAKETKAEKKTGYEYVRAIRDAEGNLRWEYKLHGNISARMSHDDDVSEYSEQDIVRLTASMLSVEEHEIGVIEVSYE